MCGSFTGGSRGAEFRDWLSRVGRTAIQEEAARESERSGRERAVVSNTVTQRDSLERYLVAEAAHAYCYSWR